MFVSSGQFFTFIASVGFGSVSGILFTLTLPFRKNFNKFVVLLLDLFVFIIIGGLFVVYVNVLEFPNFRFYMFFGVIIGIIIYIESLHLLLAKCVKKIYNIIDKKFKSKNKATNKS